MIIGTNLGGLGTMIASMASLISFKYISREDASLRGKYFIWFTAANVILLVILLAAAKILGHSLLKSTLSVTCFTKNKIASDMSAISGQFKDMETMFNL